MAREKDIRENGTLIAINPKHKSGHFYEYQGQFFRAMLTNDNVYPICERTWIDKMITEGKLIAPTGKEHFCEQCGKDIGMEYLLGAVCGRCCRINHRRVAG